ncbi:hypothetical protein EDB83DRAFT_2319428 [Lactarius deliciosus]|nr:hypothetical protein EDB83DRAFT_2319428 [Lactarius deliciosus]
MFTRTIAVDGFVELSVHCVHQRSVAKGAMPLLFIHGWPGSFVDVTKILPLLTTVSADRPSFHVVTPSFLGLRCRKGCRRKTFMRSTTLSSFCQQAHDLTGLLRIRDPRWRLRPYFDTYLGFQNGPRHVKASLKYAHVRLPNGMPARAHRLSVKRCDLPCFRENPILLLKCLISSFTARERQFFARTENLFQNCRGYSAEQATKPQALVFSLADSPVGLLAWMYEKLITRTDAYPWTDE